MRRALSNGMRVQGTHCDTTANLALRAALAARFRQSWMAILAHSLSMLAMLALQWSALISAGLGKPANWRGRTYSAS